MISRIRSVLASVSRFVQVLLGLALLMAFVFFLNALLTSRTQYSQRSSQALSLTPVIIQTEPTATPHPVLTRPAIDEVYVPKELISASWGTSEEDVGLDKGEERPPYGPQAIGVDKGGNVYILDTVNHRVKKYDNYGIFKMNILYDQNIGALDISVGSDGSIYLLNSLDEDVYRYNPVGALLSRYPKPKGIHQISRIGLDRHANLVAEGLFETTDATRPFEKVTIALGTSSEVFSESHQKESQKKGSIYRGGVAYTRLDKKNDKEGVFVVINEDGQVAAELPIDTTNPIAAVSFFDIDSSGNLYIVAETFLDSYTTRISSHVRKYNPKGHLVASFELPNVYYTVPARRIVVDDLGNIYLLLPLETQVQVIMWQKR
jgi:hypothetical protein